MTAFAEDQRIYDPFSAEYFDDPPAVWKRLRDETPLYFNPERNLWALSRYADVRPALHNYSTFSSSRGILLGYVSEETENLADSIPTLIMQDPPSHGRYRSLVARAFGREAINELVPQIRGIASRLIEEALEAGECEFVSQVASVLSSETIGIILGLPAEDRRPLGQTVAALLSQEPGTEARPPEALTALSEFLEYCAESIRRRSRQPGSDLMSQLMQMSVESAEGPRRLSDVELIGFCATLLAAGSETVTTALADSAIVLARHPDQRALVATEPALVPQAFAESMRYMGTATVGRSATRDVVLHDQVIPAGSAVALLIGSANRDERSFPDPDQFDIRRDNRRALTFGSGIHTCLGQWLARSQCHITLSELLARAPDYEVDEAGLERANRSNLVGYKRVPMSGRKSR